VTAVRRAVATFPLDGADWSGGVRYGPHGPDERRARLLGNVGGRRVLVLGGGAGQLPVTLASQGARVIVVEPDPTCAELVRNRALDTGAHVELHQRDPAELAFVRADTIDVVVSVISLTRAADLARLFRQVHRVLRHDAPMVLSLPHPVLALVDGPAGRSYCGGEPRPHRVNTPRGEVQVTEHPHTVETLVTALTRTNFALDAVSETLAEPGPGEGLYWSESYRAIPTVLVVRARRLGR
jgi:SAM-dependent methyltransferase